MKFQKTVSIKEVARVRDRLDNLLERAKKHKFSDKELEETTIEQTYEDTLDLCQEELRIAFDFDGEEK